MVVVAVRAGYGDLRQEGRCVRRLLEPAEVRRAQAAGRSKEGQGLVPARVLRSVLMEFREPRTFVALMEEHYNTYSVRIKSVWNA